MWGVFEGVHIFIYCFQLISGYFLRLSCLERWRVTRDCYTGERYARSKKGRRLSMAQTYRRENALHRAGQRWVVERTLAWISRTRRLARDFENLARTATALVRLAMIKLMVRRLARI